MAMSNILLFRLGRSILVLEIIMVENAFSCLADHKLRKTDTQVIMILTNK